MKKLAHITDLHIDDFLAREFKIDARNNFENTLRLAHSRGISDVILTGDLGAPEAHDWIFETIRSYGFDVHLALGNHDDRSGFQKFDFIKTLMNEDGLFFSLFIDGLEYKSIFLDSSSEEIGEKQLEWLRHQVTGSNEPLLVFIHHPILDCGNTIIDRLYPLRNRDTVRQVLIDAKRQISIFCGHCHYRNPEEIREGELRQFLTPSTVGQIQQTGEEIVPDNGYIAYREIWIQDKQLYTQVIEVN